MLRALRSLPERLTSRRGSWIALAIGILALVAVIGALGRASVPAGNAAAPAASESSLAAAEAETFPDADEQTVLLVASRADGAELAADDLEAFAGLLPAIEAETGATASGPIPSEDGEAAVLPVTVEIGDDDEGAETAVHGLRTLLEEHPLDGLTVQVTGGPAFGVDVAAAFDGADFTLLLVTLGIVALLLVLTYRSPVLWIVPLVVVALADQAANKATAAIGTAMGLQFDSGIVSVLVFGAGTNYALLLVSRYRDELTRESDHRRALVTAWRRTGPAVLASNATVVLSLLTLVLAVIPGTRGLGIASAIGLIIALAAVLLVLPPALAVCGRGVFWPFVPRVSEDGSSTPAGGRGWRAVATGVARRPWLPLLGGVALLGVLATGVLGASVGLSQAEKFRVPSESAVGLEVLGEHFPPGEAQPMIVLVDSAEADAATEAIEGVDGIIRVTPAGESSDGDRTRLVVTGEPAPGTDESLRLVEDVRKAAHGVAGAGALVGGPVAVDVDARAGNLQDFLLIVPLVLAVCLLVLMMLLRAVVAPVVLLVVNTLSAVAAIGAGTWISRTVFGWDSLDLQVPLLSFLFLVALGIDYTIFLVHRARAEAGSVGTTAGMVNAVASTGGVITSAGIVLAAVFAALGLLPLVTLGQIGLIVGIGVIVDTFVVRTVVVPALFAVIGDAMWWPSRAPRPPRQREQSEAGAQGEECEDAQTHSFPSAVR
ncbi:MMPL family transporter [Microbacterium sp. LWO13-1.2]|uniref:MMPL family transporter n=1 Tax=Microbacterium sp. LWO13-1.2 TaxID=3135262 RepID=UPI003138A0CA